MTEQDNFLSIISLACSIALTISIIYANSAGYRDRSSSLKQNYIELQLLLDQLSCTRDDDTECIMSISAKYADLLKASENHIPIDLYRLKANSTDSTFTYVDDILILCNSSEAGEIKNFCVETLKTDYILDANEKKTMFGEIVNGVPYLGYMFFDSKVGIRPSAEEKLEDSIEELFRLRKKQTISPQVFIWRLNLRITGCILDSQKYGWLFYYSQLTDLSILFHLDWFVGHLFSRYGFDRPKDIKRFIRSYHEITKNISRSSYIINADRYSFEEKAEILSEIYNQRNFNKNDARTVDSLFKATMFKEVQRLEYDIQNFS